MNFILPVFLLAVAASLVTAESFTGTSYLLQTYNEELYSELQSTGRTASHSRLLIELEDINVAQGYVNVEMFPSSSDCAGGGTEEVVIAMGTLTIAKYF